jgi:catechol 2,3-dioxygenase-like lactoylglutathione lyase family enzyme
MILPKLKILFVFFIFNSILGMAQNAPRISDPLEAKSSPDSALCEQLHTVTLCTSDLENTRLFYEKGMGMTLNGPIKVSKKVKKMQRKLWDVPKDIDWQLYILSRPAVPKLIQIRLLVLNKKTPYIHESYDSRELGSFSIGFPNAMEEKLDAKLHDMGFKSMAPLQAALLQRPDGSKYRYMETIYQAPDFVHCVGIERGDGMTQLSPEDPVTKLGGPGYSAQVISGESDKNLAFYTDVLGLELRSDRQWKSGKGSALGIEEGIPFRFSLVYAKGANFGHCLFLDFKEGRPIPLKVAPKVPNRGLGMWTFPTKNIAKVYQNALAKGTTVVLPPTALKTPELGKAKVMTLLAPNGFLIEIFEKY